MVSDKILLVDTEKNILNTYQAVLEEEGYQIDIALTLDEAFSKISQNNYSIVISELYLGGSSTLPFISQLHKQKPDTYLIILTSLSVTPGIYKSLYDSGVLDCFLKPYPIQNLLVDIKKGLKIRSLYLATYLLERNVENLNFSPHKSMVYNNYSFINIICQECIRTNRFKHPFSLLQLSSTIPIYPEMIPRWREVIEEITLANIRQTDIFTRINGTYCIFLPETSKVSSNVLIARLMSKINSSSSIAHNSLTEKIVKRLHVNSLTYPEDIDIIKQYVEDLNAELKSFLQNSPL